MANGFAAIELDGLQEFQRAARRSTDTELPKRLGRAHKHIGQLVIDRLQPRPDPAAIGSGKGSTVRASASKRDVLLRDGGTHRAGHSPQMQWGKSRPERLVANRRPYIRETIDANYDEIADEYLGAISAAMSGAFDKTTP